MNYIGNFIREYRGKTSLRDFAERCGISHTHLDSIEKGIDPRTGKPVKVTVETLKKISNAMNMSINDLLLQSGDVKIEDIVLNNNIKVEEKLNIDKKKLTEEKKKLEKENKELEKEYKKLKESIKKRDQNILHLYKTYFSILSDLLKKKEIPIEEYDTEITDLLFTLKDGEIINKEQYEEMLNLYLSKK